MQDTFCGNITFAREILIHQDCAIANSGDQKMVHEMIDEFEDK
jgi:hypothetical protein